MQQDVPDGYKLTEVGVIPEDWKVLTLGEITQSKRPISYGIVQTGPRVDGGVRCLRVVDISNGVISKVNLITTTTGISNSYRRTQLQLHDLVIPLRGKVGEVGLIDQDLVGDNLTRGVALIALKGGYSPIYIKQAISFEGSAKRLESSMNGSALQEIPIAVLRSFKVAIPSEYEQGAIAKMLVASDVLITSLEKLIAKKRAIKAATMQQLLTGKKRLPPFDKSHTGYKQTELGEIPKDWKVMALSGITQAKRPISYGIVQTGPLISGGVRCLRVVDISNGSISKDNLITTAAEISNSYRRTQLQLNDLVIPLRGKVGEVGLIDADLVGDNLTRGVALIALTEGYSPSFIKQAISFEDNAKRLENSMNGSALQEISIAALRSFKMSIPSASEQAAISEVLTAMDTDIDGLVTWLNKNQQLKQGMMQELFTGKTRLIAGTA